MVGHLERQGTDLSEKIDQSDFKSAQQRLHKLKGSAEMIGAMRLHRAAAGAEEACKMGDRKALETGMKAVSVELSMAKAEANRLSVH